MNLDIWWEECFDDHIWFTVNEWVMCHLDYIPKKLAYGVYHICFTHYQVCQGL